MANGRGDPRADTLRVERAMEGHRSTWTNSRTYTSVSALLCLVVGLLGYARWGRCDLVALVTVLSGVACVGVGWLVKRDPSPLSLAARDRGMYARVEMVMELVERVSLYPPDLSNIAAARAYEACISARDALIDTIKKPLVSPWRYSVYDVVFERMAEIRHELCELLSVDELETLALEIREDIDGYVEHDKRAAALRELDEVMGELRMGGLRRERFDHLRAELRRLSRLGSDPRQVCWRKVNRLRGRLLTSCVGLSLILGILIWQLPEVLAVETSTRLFLAAVFGAAGGLLSALMVRESSVLPSRVFYVEQLLLFMRPLVGAMSGLMLYLLQVTGAFSIEISIGSSQGSGNFPFFIAFAGGFSERLLLARLASATAKADREISNADSARSPRR